MNGTTGRVLTTLGVLALACGAAAATDTPPRGQDLADLQMAIHRAGTGPATWHVTTVSAHPGDSVQKVEVVGDLDDARRALERQFPGRTTVVRGHAGQDLLWDRGQDHALEQALLAVDRSDWQVFETGVAPDGRTSVGVVGDLAAARTFLDTRYPGRTVVHGNGGD
ncbi:hypothetical protein ACFC58_41450 [Kitasatospora purpeofusca]|uniref:hypothetical protein n=1 Tax=Kitasatospora purpeofusca TaxID=67352 RepID=UPI0035DA4AE8